MSCIYVNIYTYLFLRKEGTVSCPLTDTEKLPLAPLGRQPEP